MCASLIRIVKEPRVARFHAPACVCHFTRGFDRKGHDPYKNGQARFALNQGVSCLGIVQTVTGIVRFGNDWVERTSVERGIHFISDLLQSPL